MNTRVRVVGVIPIAHIYIAGVEEAAAVAVVIVVNFVRAKRRSFVVRSLYGKILRAASYRNHEP